ncbi:HDOD domain-containing protein [Janthinobacterium fluminis]|uniref:histidine kinase n=1 Tax=Janthinobacterium fluminis TaxID=2987524 RepID=A0ABT5K6W5_9BURK|nr:HDOD domain-containing protein [Janthinobacterium fluminis]MDC8759507.1 HDOD domain-containing protein [Janthinobacterium fluminis]
MPQILIKLIEHLQADDAGMPELAALIAKDAGMTSKILAVANSSAYQRHSRNVGLEQSLVSLGTDMIKTLVISESVFQTFNSFPHSAGTDLRAFWKSSLTAAVLARDIAKASGYAHVEEAYLAGLLHNVGRLALLATAPKEYGFNFMARDDDALCAVEQRTLQITHSEAGAWLIERWHLDSFLADSVLYHHEPVARLESAHPLIRIVRLAHLLCCHEEQQTAIADASRLCGLGDSALAIIAKAAARQVAKAAEQLGIDLAGADDVAAPPAVAPAPPDPVQQRLSEEVRNMVLVSEMGQTFARQQGEAGLLDSITRSARILFDFGTTVVLLENATGLALVGAAGGEQQQRLAEFAIPLAKGGPLAAAALQRRLAFVGRADAALGIVEDQLFRILGTDSLVCLPLLAGQRCLGVLIGGVHAWQVAGYQQRERFLQSFGHQAAVALETSMSERGHARRQLAHVAEEYREASRRVVHEVNNPLAIIKNYLSVLDSKLARNEAVVGEMAILNEEIDRVGQLVGGLAELQPSEGGRVADAARVAAEVLRLFRATGFVPASVQIVARMLDEPAEVEADADMLKQVLVNLVKNAVEAMPAGGTIEICNRGHVNRERRLYVELCVSDSGPGLSAEVLANLFSPVRSGKDGAHHGLGLSIVHGLVKKMQGMISCRSGRNGTSFEILLPARGGASRQPGAVTRALDPA